MAMEIERQVLTKLAQQHNGVLTVDDVLNEAQDEGSPLHRHFEWDDSIAAASFRREQARTLIQRCKITLVQDEPVEIRAFVSLPEDRESGGGYRLTTTVMNNESLRDELLHDIRLTIARWNRKLHLLDSVTADLLMQLDRHIDRRGDADQRAAA